MIYYNFNLNGEGAQVSALTQQERETYVYNRFMARAKNIAKYYARAHNMSEGECTLFVASSLYNKMCDIRHKEIERTGVHYNAVEYLSMIKTFSQLKIARNRANFAKTTDYINHSEFDTPDFNISFRAVEGIKNYTVKSHHFKATSEKRENIEARNISTKTFDYVDICEMWDNRHARHEYKLSRALENLNSLTSVYEYTSDKHYLTMTQEERERAKKALNKQLHADAVRYNALSQITKLSRSFSAPESDLLNKCALIRARKLIHKIYTETQSGARIIDIISSDRVQTPAERRAVCDFRKRHNALYDEMDYLQERVTQEINL